MPRPCSKDRPASSGFLRPDDLNRLIHLTLRVTAAGEPFSQPYDNNNAYDFSADLDCRCGRAELLYHEHIGYQHTARNPAQQARAQGDHDGETIDKLQDYCARSEEHTSELQSLMRISYAVFCLKKKKSQSIKQKNETSVKTTTKTKRRQIKRKNIKNQTKSTAHVQEKKS